METYNNLKVDLKLLYEGSSGKMTTAVLIKLKLLLPGKCLMKHRFLEVWKLLDGKVIKDGG